MVDGGDLAIHIEVFEKGIGPQSFRIQGESKRRRRIFDGDSLGPIYGGLEVAEMIQLGENLKAIPENRTPLYPTSIRIETMLVICSCYWSRSFS